MRYDLLWNLLMNFGNGPWKQGRMGGASLCYLDPTPAQLAWIDPHHAAVGIRATIACGPISPPLTDRLVPLVGRNWDLAALAPAEPSCLADLHTLDQRTTRGLVMYAPDATVASPATIPDLYHVHTHPGSIPPRGQVDPHHLPSMIPPTALPALHDAIDHIVHQHHWTIWRFDRDTLDALGPTSHQQLLQWLGDHHGRVWCAPIRDILEWRSKPT